MARYGYARVSSEDQSLGLQEERLKAVGCDIVQSKKVNGATRTGISELALLLEFIRPGDSLVVTRIDRLARSVADLQDLMRELRAKGVVLEVTEQNIDTSTASGKAFLDMLGVFAEFENSLRRERQAEGIRKAKLRGVYKGRPAKTTAQQVQELIAEGMGPSFVARHLGVGRATVYRALARRGDQAAA